MTSPFYMHEPSRPAPRWSLITICTHLLKTWSFLLLQSQHIPTNLIVSLTLSLSPSLPLAPFPELPGSGNGTRVNPNQNPRVLQDSSPLIHSPNNDQNETFKLEYVSLLLKVLCFVLLKRLILISWQELKGSVWFDPGFNHSFLSHQTLCLGIGVLSEFPACRHCSQLYSQASRPGLPPPTVTSLSCRSLLLPVPSLEPTS